MGDGDGVGVRIGGGAIAVDTEEMLHAAAVLAEARGALLGLADRAAAAGEGASPALAVQLRDARGLLLQAAAHADRATEGLRTAALRYGLVEQVVDRGVQAAWAEGAALQGGIARLLGPPGAAALLAVDVLAAGAVVAARVAQRWIETGAVAPQSDPVLIRGLQLGLSSMDDGIRGWLLIETPWDVLHDDARSPFGTQTIAAAISILLWPVPRGPVAVARRTVAPTARPASIAELVDRLPQGEEPAGQIRIERYEDPAGPRWIVYSAGTVTFDVDSGAEPFDLESNLDGVGGLPADSQQALLDAMDAAGIGADDPVLLVGHSQGALNAMRIAERGGHRVEGVVQLGGPTAQIPAPPGVEVLSVRHDEDLVPALGGVAAAGLGTVVVTRSLPDGGRLPPRSGPAGLIDDFPAHDTRNYRETVRRAEAAGDPAIVRQRRVLRGFFEGADGTATRYRAERPPQPEERVVRPGPTPSPTAGAAPAPPATR